jgi:hypothetical protein
VVFPGAAGRSVPDFQGDAVLLGGPAVFVENFATGGIGAGENQLGHRHRESVLSSESSEGKTHAEPTLQSNRVVLILVTPWRDHGDKRSLNETPGVDKKQRVSIFEQAVRTEDRGPRKKETITRVNGWF